MRRLTLLAAVLVMAGGVCCKKTPSGPPIPPGLDELAADFRMVATQLADEVRADSKGADERYIGKVLEVTGIFFTWTLDNGQGGNRHAIDITLQIPTREATKLLFELDRKLMDKKFLVLDYNSYITMKGRYAGRREDGTLLLRDAVLTTSFVNLHNLPAYRTVTAAALGDAYRHLEDSDEFRKYQGHLVQVQGVAIAAAESGAVLLDSGDPAKPVYCDFVDQAKAKEVPLNRPVTIKGLRSGTIQGAVGVSLEKCVLVPG